MRMILGFLLVLPMQSWATVTVGNSDCPVSFQGKVKEVVDEVGPETPFSTQKVIFEKTKNIRGTTGKQISVDVLKNGPFTVKPGEDYQVQVRDGNICWIQRI